MEVMVQSYSKCHFSNSQEEPRVAGVGRKVSNLTYNDRVSYLIKFKTL